mgnify:CR=1 FL=1
MPKMRTNRSAAKRLRKTSGGKVKRGKAYHRHLLTSKNMKRKRRLRAISYVSPANQLAIDKLLPN